MPDPEIRVAWAAARVMARDELLDAIVRILERRTATRPLGTRVARAIAVFRNVEAEEDRRGTTDSAGRVLAVGRDRAARLELASGHEKAPSYLVAAKGDELMLAGVFHDLHERSAGVTFKAPPDERRRKWILLSGLRACGISPLPTVAIDKALAARSPQDMAFRIVYHLHAWPDHAPEDFRKKLSRITLRPTDESAAPPAEN
jgi:hypothetical protein